MEKRLSDLFDYQRFEQNPELDAIIRSVEMKTGARRLSLDEAEFVAAAGEKVVPAEQQEEKLWK